MKIVIEPGAICPTRAHPYDASLDLYSPVDRVIPPCSTWMEIVGREKKRRVTVGSALIDTGIHMEIPEGYVGMIKSKSGLNVKHGLTAEGVIDAHYTGSIAVKLYNHTAQPYTVRAGDKIAQLVILPCLLEDLEPVDSLGVTDRGTGGFGSTGR